MNDDLPSDETPTYVSDEWVRQYLANLASDVTPMYGLAVATPTAIADLFPSDATPPEPSPVDTVIDSLSRDRVSRSDRGRLGDALGKANDRADGHKAGPSEAFGRIAGR